MEAPHLCQRPDVGMHTARHAHDQDQWWTCPECEAVWAFAISREGQCLGACKDKIRFIVREWTRRRSPRGDFS
jgi:hypothetical protein